MNNDPLPTPYELDSAPELAVLAVLDAAIEATTRALVALYPGLCGEREPPSEQEPEVRSAARLLRQANRLQDALAQYRQVVLRDPPMESGAAEGLDVPSAQAPGAF